MSDDVRKASVTSVSGRRKSVAEEPVTSVLSANEVPVFDRELTADEEVLAALGYKYVQWRTVENNVADIRTGPNSNENSHYGRPFVSHLPF